MGRRANIWLKYLYEVMSDLWLQRWYSLSLIFLCSLPRWKWKGFISPMVNRACPPEGQYHPHTRTGETFTQLGLLRMGEKHPSSLHEIHLGFHVQNVLTAVQVLVSKCMVILSFWAGPVCVSDLVLCGRCMKLLVHWISKTGWNWCVLLFLVKVRNLMIIE